MPTLNLRTVGMSYIFEGFDAAGLDGRLVLAALTDVFGMAVAPLGSEVEGNSKINGIIIDRKAASWDVIRDWVETWIKSKGYQYVSWADDGLTRGAATLHFHP